MWWEKTVECRFVADVVANGMCDFAASLSGRYERTAGNAIFGKGSGLVLVEFKRSLSDVPTEETLFESYGDAKAALSQYEHHFIVFGELAKDCHTNLELLAQRYFVAGDYFDGITVLQHGVSKLVFDEYLHALAEHKEEDGRGRGIGHVTDQAMSAVIGVSADGQMVGAISLHEYAPTLFPGPVLLPPPAPTPIFSPSGPGR
ncbi:hypothetical protein [Pseudomonas rhodesiae]|uniref:hypothetical protein n=1 Tax=Pseudomonas rhodesiae TaxID=76760 RepID=UPI00289B91AC|nr:hypothetical protein [Pseudomonas rhodesiae]